MCIDTFNEIELEKKLQKYQELHTSYKSNAISISKTLDGLGITDGYTFHDGRHHCRKIKQYANNLLPIELINELPPEAIYILLCAIYYHDIGMKDPSKRKRHNVIAKKMIYNEKTQKYNKDIINIPYKKEAFAKHIANLCYAHRDHETSQSEICNTLQEVDNEDAFENGKIYPRYLACILRIADELDSTYSRAPEDIFRDLQSFLDERAKEEWRKHQLIKSVIIDSNIFTITLYPDEEEMKKLDKIINNDMYSTKLILSKVGKIEEEIENCFSTLTGLQDKKYHLGYQKVNIKYGSYFTKKKHKIYLSLVKSAIKEETFEDLNIPITTEESEDIEIAKPQFDLTYDNDTLNRLKLNFNNEIDKIHDNNNLILIGHFKLHSGYSKYFLRINSILTINHFLNQITDIFFEYYSNNKFKIDYILAIGKSGFLICPNLSLKLNTNYTYIITDDDDKKIANSFELRTSLKPKSNIVIIDGIISTGKTLNSVLNRLKTKYKILSIGFSYCIF